MICIASQPTGPFDSGPVHYNTGPADIIQKYGTGPSALKKALPDTNLALKIAYRMGIWLSKSLTGRESGHDMTKMPFSIFYCKLSYFSHITH